MARVGFRGVLAASVAVVASLLASTVTAPAANAVGKRWGTIYAMDGDRKISSADGDFANNGGVYATVGANWRDLYNDGRASYVEVNFAYYVKGKWESAGKTQSSRTTTHASQALSSRLKHDGTAARAVIKVCVDRNHLPDICSNDAVVSFSY